MVDKELYALAERVGLALKAQAGILATAESCTGGWIAQTVTMVPGSSAWFDRSFVTYSNAAKIEMLGVPAEVIAKHGAVSEQTACAMVAGALAHSRAQMTVAVTGIAGPDGGTAQKPVGTVWFAWAEKGKMPASEIKHFTGDRDAVRRQAVIHALQGVLERVEIQTA